MKRATRGRAGCSGNTDPGAGSDGGGACVLWSSVITMGFVIACATKLSSWSFIVNITLYPN